AAGRDHRLAALAPVRAHAGEDDAEQAAAIGLRQAAQHRIDRGPAEILGRTAVEAQRPLAAFALDHHVVVAGRDVDAPGARGPARAGRGPPGRPASASSARYARQGWW